MWLLLFKTIDVSRIQATYLFYNIYSTYCSSQNTIPAASKQLKLTTQTVSPSAISVTFLFYTSKLFIDICGVLLILYWDVPLFLFLIIVIENVLYQDKPLEMYRLVFKRVPKNPTIIHDTTTQYLKNKQRNKKTGQLDTIKRNMISQWWNYWKHAVCLRWENNILKISQIITLNKPNKDRELIFTGKWFQSERGSDQSILVSNLKHKEQKIECLNDHPRQIAP